MNTQLAQEVLTEYVRSIDGTLADNSSHEGVALTGIKNIADDTPGYLQWLLEQRNRAVAALDALEAPHDFTAQTPDIPRV